jgi:hypothetical protein
MTPIDSVISGPLTAMSLPKGDSDTVHGNWMVFSGSFEAGGRLPSIIRSVSTDVGLETVAVGPNLFDFHSSSPRRQWGHEIGWGWRF